MKTPSLGFFVIKVGEVSEYRPTNLPHLLTMGKFREAASFPGVIRCHNLSWAPYADSAYCQTTRPRQQMNASFLFFSIWL
jgi:hypothetical protein